MLDPTTVAVLIGGGTPVGALALGFAGVQTAKAVGKHKIRRAERRLYQRELAYVKETMPVWTAKFEEGRRALAQIVNSGDELDPKTALQTQIDLLTYFHEPIAGCQTVTYRSAYSDALEGMHLTHVYQMRDGGRAYHNFQRIDTHRKYGNESRTPVDLDLYLNGLKKLLTNLSSEFVSADALVKEANVFVREHAAHLLLNYRPSVESALAETEDHLLKATARQRELDKTLRNLNHSLQDVISWEVQAVNPASKALDEAKTLAKTLVVDSAEGKQAEGEVSPQGIKRESIADDPTWLEGELRSSERELIQIYKTALPTFTEEQQAVGESLLSKLAAAVNLATKAQGFSPAGKAHATSLAEQNRSLVIAELSSLVEPSLLAEEAAAIYALRLDNKYLLARHNEAMEGTQNV